MTACIAEAGGGLPWNVWQEILLYAVYQDPCGVRRAAIRLAPTCRAWFTLMYSRIVLPTLYLHTPRHAIQCAQALASNQLGLGAIAQQVTRAIYIRDTEQRPALYDDAMHTRRLATTLHHPVRLLLCICIHVHTLCLPCEPKMLQAHNGDGLDMSHTRATLQQITCLQSAWAGDVNDTLWLPCPAPWQALTHVQLHGPRFRCTPRVARALAHLPTLTHLALVLPTVLDEQGGRDARPVLQILCTEAQTLQCLLVLGHDEPHWMGATRHIRPALPYLTRPATLPSLRCGLITAMRLDDKEWQPGTRAHASVFSAWMMQRMRQGTHWSFLDARDPGMDDTMAYDVASFVVPPAIDTPVH